MLVKATKKYKELNLQDKELKRIPDEGEEFEVSEERYRVLTETNEYNEVFIEKVEQEEVIETTTKKTKKETAVKKTIEKETTSKDIKKDE